MSRGVRSGRDALPWIAFVIAVTAAVGGVLASDEIGLKILAWIIATIVALASAVVVVFESRRSRSAPVRKLLRGAFVGGRKGEGLLAKDAPLSDLGVHSSLAEVAYVPRGLEGELGDAIARGESVLVVGGPLAGKSRLVAELVRTDLNLREKRILIPTGPGAVHDLITEEARFKDHIVFFPRFEEVLASGGLSSNDIDRITEMGNVIAATLEHRVYETVLGADAELGIDARRALERFWVLRLDGDDPATRRRHASQMSGTISEGVIEFGLGEYLAGGGIAERLFRESRDARPYAHALLRAAVDWRRSGIGEGIPKDVAIRLADAYVDTLGLVRSAEPAADQIHWAEAWLPSSKRKVFRLLQPWDGETWRPFDHLTSLVERDQLHPAIPLFAWEEIAKAPATPGQLAYAGIVAHEQDPDMEPTGRILQRAAEAGDPVGMTNYALVLARRGDPVAEEWYRRSAEAGEPVGMSSYGVVLEKRGDPDAEEWYRRSAEAGQPTGMSNYGALLDKRGDPDAEEWFRRSAEAGEPTGMSNYGALLGKRGDPAAEEWLRRSAEAGDAGGMSNYGALLARRGDPAAEEWLRRSTEAGNAGGMSNYGAFLAERGDPAAAEWLRRAEEAADDSCSRR